jgi:Bacteriophage probable baseplate hub protein
MAQEVYNNAETVPHIKNKLRQANKHEFHAEFEMPGHINWREGKCFMLDGSFGNFNGKYIIERATHQVDQNGNFTVAIQAHKVLKGY